MKQISEELIEKLRKVKALADDAKDENEGIAALLAFQRLLSKNGLSEQEIEIELDEEDKAEVNEVESIKRSRVDSWQVFLHAMIGKHFRCMSTSTKERKWVGSYTKKTETLKYVGMGNDPMLATKAFEAALTVAGNMWLKHKDEYHWESPTKAKNAYMLGFKQGMEEAFNEQEAKAELGLIIVRDKRVDESLKGLRTSNRSMSIDGNTELKYAGFVDGNNFGKGNALSHRELAGALT